MFVFVQNKKLNKKRIKKYLYTNVTLVTTVESCFKCKSKAEKFKSYNKSYVRENT